MYSFPNSFIMAIELDAENIQNDMLGIVEQSLFVVDDNHKVYQLRDKGDQFEVLKTIDIPNKNLDLDSLQNDWMNVHVS